MEDKKEGAFSSEDKKKILQEREKNWVAVQIKVNYFSNYQNHLLNSF